jgi:hypothetical protein
MLSVPLRAEPYDSRDSNPFGAEAPYREVTDIFTTAAPARRTRGRLGSWGTIDFGGTPSDTRSASREALAARDAPACQADSTARSIGGGTQPAFPWERSIQNLHHQRMLSHARETSHDWY